MVGRARCRRDRHGAASERVVSVARGGGTVTPAETRAAIRRAARVSNRPFRSAPLPRLQPGEERRYLRQLDGEDSERAIERARMFTWWCAVKHAWPRHPGDRWAWTVETARLP
jgi:hypothetical protein